MTGEPKSCLDCTAGEVVLMTRGLRVFCHEVDGVVPSSDAEGCECYERRAKP